LTAAPAAAHIPFAELAGAAPMPQQQIPPEERYAEYDPVEGLPSARALIMGWSSTEIAATGAKVNAHVPTPDEIAKRKYVIRRYRWGPRWMRWLFGTGEYSPK
jgi:hypothetical protein